ncbi:MAG TPA: hypothetical protein VEX88_12375 [Glaciibacter sp.]|nr:hypothetical protein [Glaciibacter sp.]
MITLGLGILTLANAVLYVVAAILHWGVRIAVGPIVLAFPVAIPAATAVETVIALCLTAGAIAVLGRFGRAMPIIWAAYGLALVGTLFGLTIALIRGLEGPDIWVHFVMLAGLAGGFALLLIGRRTSRARPMRPNSQLPEVRDGRD